MIGYLFVYMNNSIFDGNICLQSAVEKVYNLLDNSDLNTIIGKKMVPCNLAIPRKQELSMCLNRFRKINITKY